MKKFKHGSREHQKWGVRITILLLTHGYHGTHDEIIENWSQADYEEFCICFGLTMVEDVDVWLDENKEYFQEEYLKLSKPE